MQTENQKIMKNLTTPELFEIASQKKAKSRKGDMKRLAATVVLINRAAMKSGLLVSSVLEAVAILCPAEVQY